MVEIGQKIKISTEFGAHQDSTTGLRQLAGTIVYIHPALRFAVVEYSVLNGTFKEAFSMQELGNPNRRMPGDRPRG